MLDTILILSPILVILIIRFIKGDPKRAGPEKTKTEMMLRHLGRTQKELKVQDRAFLNILLNKSNGVLFHMCRAFVGNTRFLDYHDISYSSTESLLWLFATLDKNDDQEKIITEHLIQILLERDIQEAKILYMILGNNIEPHMVSSLISLVTEEINGLKKSLLLLAGTENILSGNQELEIWSKCKQRWGYTDPVREDFAGFFSCDDSECFSTESSLWGKLALKKMMRNPLITQDDYRTLENDLAGITDSLEDMYVITGEDNMGMSMYVNGKSMQTSSMCSIMDIMERHGLSPFGLRNGKLEIIKKNDN
jgi:hypothetical protein